MNIERGQVLWIDEPLNAKDHEQKGSRPCVVVSANFVNSYYEPPAPIVMLGTEVAGKQGKAPSYWIWAGASDTGLPFATFFKPEQIFTLSATRLKMTFKGRDLKVLSSEALSKINRGLGAALGLSTVASLLTDPLNPFAKSSASE